MPRHSLRVAPNGEQREPLPVLARHLNRGARKVGEMKRLSAAIQGSCLKKIIDIWPEVQKLLDIGWTASTIFIFRSFEELPVVLYINDKYTGLWFPCDPRDQKKLLNDLFSSDFANNEGLAKEKWGDLRILPDGYRLILDLAQSIKDTGNNNKLNELPEPDCVKSEITINSPTHDRLLRAIAAFPARYPDYLTRPPKLDPDIRPWLEETGLGTSTRERGVFGVILAEHFNLSSDAQKLQQ